MNSILKQPVPTVRRQLSKLRFLAVGAFMSVLAGMPVAQSAVNIDQQPLTVSNNVPGNLVLTPSVEWPTVMSLSNLGNFFDSSKTYGGYFDADKCYKYRPNGSIPTSTPAPQKANPKGEKGYFAPSSVSATSPATCSGNKWSGNYLNWATTQTIDTFRSVMTGGYRVVDTATKTVLEKARNTGQGYAERGLINGSSLVPSMTPASYKYFQTRIRGLGNKMYFIASTTPNLKDKYGATRTLNYLINHIYKTVSGNVVAYKPSQGILEGQVYSVNIDVQVCKPGLLESNCVKYGINYKPEGLIQKYSKSLTYSVFGYLNISKHLQDGAALRANQKFVGPFTYDPVSGQQPNPNMEWDPLTGIFVQNPDPTAAANTTSAIGGTKPIADSGIINYINKFGEMTTANDKSYDPVSEMYYAAVRYLKHQGPVASYSNMTTYANGTPYKMADGFPVVTSWNDPLKFSCQKSFILGIGDVNTWDDKNLPGNTVTNYEPPVPPEVTADTTVNVMTELSRIGTIQGITIRTSPDYSGRHNSAYIAALAYNVHTKDMRPGLAGEQTASTYWVDVEENQILRHINRGNQYQLAAKYGGFKVPSGFNPNTYAGPMPQSWWHTTGDVLSNGAPRPDNFFEGGDAKALRSGLSAAFSAIYSANLGSQSSLALSSTQLQTGTAVYQATYKEGVWSGSLAAYPVDPVTKTVSGTPEWAASLPAYNARSVYTFVNGAYKAFNSTNVTGNGWNTATVNYVLGQDTYEIKNGGTLRNRTTALGDIVHSQPVYVGAPNSNLFSGATFTGSASYAAFASSKASRTPVVYVSANDGMLHAFNANSSSANAGKELYAFMPGAVVSASTNPSKLADSSYGSSTNPHQYFNDGQITVADVYLSGAWKTVLVGTIGRGKAAAIYALDVTDPTNIKFLWEKDASSSGHAAYIGQITGKPIIAQTVSGWVVLVGNGYNSVDNKAALLSIPLDGSSMTVYTTNTTTNNGLATPGVWIGNTSTGIATTAYAGDLKGNLWAFDLSSPSGTGTLVYTTQIKSGRHQSITATVLLGKDPATGHLWAFFGTGKYLATPDLSDNQVQSWYGLIVDQTVPIVQSDLVQRDITAETAGQAANPNVTPPTPAVNPARAFSQQVSGDMAGKSGWFMNLIPPSNTAEGERMIVDNSFKNGLLIGTSLIPNISDVCSPGGRGWVMAINPFSGTNPSNIFFDLNGDGQFNSQDKISVNGSLVPAGGIGFTSLTGSAAFTGTVMLVNQNGAIASRQINPPTSASGRVSWRELVNP